MGGPGPDFLIIGAPKAGTTALHSALACHPQVFVSHPKEPKYWLCDDAPPPHWRGPGDKHSQQEWIWRRRDYEALFARAPEGTVRGESTPFYLWSTRAQQRIAASLPDVRLIAVVRDPVDRAYSNWMHLWCDGLEPCGDFLEAFAREEERIEAGYAPFWRYRELGLYGAQLASLYSLVPRSQVLVLRYKDIVDTPVEAVDTACRFLGIETGHVPHIPKDNSRRYVEPGWRPRVLGPLVRSGAWLGQFAPPEAWRRVEPYARRALVAGGAHHRPILSAEQRARLLPAFADDIKLLSSVTDRDFSDWLSTEPKGSFAQRAAEPTAPDRP